MSRARPGATGKAARAAVVAALAAIVAALAPPVPAMAVGEGQWWHDQWEMEQAWSITDGSGVTVAVIDSGVDANLPELAGAVVAGTDLVGDTDGRVDGDTENSHGTRIATLIAGRGGGSGVTGAAPGATILPVTVPLSSGVQEAVDRYTEGIRYATDQGAQVINMSLNLFYGGGAGEDDCPDNLTQAVKYAADNDVIVVAGAGNLATGSTGIPASCPGVLTVGATDQQREPWVSSHRSQYLDVAAPGVDVATVGPVGGVQHNSGTSGSSALAAGAVALVRAEFPEASADEVLARIVHTATDVHESGWDEATGHGLIQPDQALTADVPPDTPNPVWERLAEVGDPAPPPPEHGPTIAPIPPGAMPDQGGGGADTEFLLLLAGVGGLVLLLLLAVAAGVVAVVLSRNRRRRLQYASQAGPPPPEQAGPGHPGPRPPT